MKFGQAVFSDGLRQSPAGSPDRSPVSAGRPAGVNRCSPKIHYTRSFRVCHSGSDRRLRRFSATCGTTEGPRGRFSGPFSMSPGRPEGRFSGSFSGATGGQRDGSPAPFFIRKQGDKSVRTGFQGRKTSAKNPAPQLPQDPLRM